MLLTLLMLLLAQASSHAEESVLPPAFWVQLEIPETAAPFTSTIREVACRALIRAGYRQVTSREEAERAAEWQVVIIRVVRVNLAASTGRHVDRERELVFYAPQWRGAVELSCRIESHRGSRDLPRLVVAVTGSTSAPPAVEAASLERWFVADGGLTPAIRINLDHNRPQRLPSTPEAPWLQPGTWIDVKPHGWGVLHDDHEFYAIEWQPAPSGQLTTAWVAPLSRIGLSLTGRVGFALLQNRGAQLNGVAIPATSGGLSLGLCLGWDFGARLGSPDWWLELDYTFATGGNIRGHAIELALRRLVRLDGPWSIAPALGVGIISAELSADALALVFGSGNTKAAQVALTLAAWVELEWRVAPDFALALMTGYRLALPFDGHDRFRSHGQLGSVPVDFQPSGFLVTAGVRLFI